MKLDVDLNGLWACAKAMDAPPGDFRLERPADGPEVSLELELELSSPGGTPVSDDNLDQDNGVLSVYGRHVLLFIPDQGDGIQKVLDGTALGIASGKRFHIADCKTISEMREGKRFSKYRATYHRDGNFQIYGTRRRTGKSIEGAAALTVCRNCLDYLSYQGYKDAAKAERDRICERFDIATFLSEHSTLFSSLPERSQLIDKGGYADDWKQLSTSYRKSVRFCCEDCGVDLSKHGYLLHCHHINGNKRDNRSQNLTALCAACHRKQPMHSHIHVPRDDMSLLTVLRKAQGLLNLTGWDAVIELTAPAFNGLLRRYQHEGRTVPEVGYQVLKEGGAIAATLEVAWPTHRKGIAVNLHDREAAQALGWTALSLGEALDRMK